MRKHLHWIGVALAVGLLLFCAGNILHLLANVGECIGMFGLGVLLKCAERPIHLIACVIVAVVTVGVFRLVARLFLRVAER